MSKNIRKAENNDLSRIAEIFVFNNRINYYPIFHDEEFSFKELQVVTLTDSMFKEELPSIYVYDDGIIRGFISIEDHEIKKLYTDPFFQSKGYGDQMINFAIDSFRVNHLWALEKNIKAVAFYNRHGFVPNGEKKFEEGTEEYLIELIRK